MSDTNNLLELAKQFDHAADSVGTEQEMKEVMAVLRHKEAIQIAQTNEALSRVAQTSMRQKECLPLREDGEDFARVEARIPKSLFFGLLKQKNFGHDGFTSDDGMKEFAKSFPQFMVKTVSGKITVGYGSKRARKAGVNFGRGTMTFAN